MWKPSRKTAFVAAASRELGAHAVARAVVFDRVHVGAEFDVMADRTVIAGKIRRLRPVCERDDVFRAVARQLEGGMEKKLMPDGIVIMPDT
jgi:hypothetical protein